MTIHRAARAAIAVLAATSLVAACGDDDDDEVGTAAEAVAGVEVTGAWARTSPAVAEAGAVYLTITNGGDADDALVDVTVDDAVAGKAELHETVEAEEAGGDTTMAGEMSGETTRDTTGMDDGMGGMMQMQPVDEIAVPAGESVALEPGGYHVMLLELAEPLEEGGTVELVLTFEEAGDVTVTAEVRDTAP
jgi:hypothetical protein